MQSSAAKQGKRILTFSKECLTKMRGQINESNGQEYIRNSHTTHKEVSDWPYEDINVLDTYI